MKELNFKELDLREQITDELKDKWYYQDFARLLTVNKHSVIFNDDFKFRLVYHKKLVNEETKDITMENDVYIDGFLEAKKGDVFHMEKGEVINEAYVSLMYAIDDNDEICLGYYSNCEYDDKPTEILKDILIYISERI